MSSPEYTENEVAKIAYTIAGGVRGGEVIELVGDVGAGKTTFTKALAVALGVNDVVQSPTFTISNRYEITNGLTLAHYDFYRLKDAGIMRDELEEVLQDEQVIIVLEWSDIVSAVLPADRLTIRFTPVTETTRRLSITAGGPKSKNLLEKLA